MSWNITWQCLTACVFAFTTFVLIPLECGKRLYRGVL